jgi:chemotaxis protein MotB
MIINRKLSFSLFTILITLMITSCVSQKKYKESLDQAAAFRADNARLTDENSNLSHRLSESEKKITDLQNQMNAAAREAGNSLNLTKEQLQIQQKRLENLQRLIDQQREVAENLRKKMADALVGFNASELSVAVKNGKVYVSLQEELLFPSGSAVVNKKGKEALGKLADVLNSNPDINVEIEGHTDSIPIRGKYADNWALSVARSTAIVRILTDDYNVNPTRVTASGRSKYDPVDTNESPEGRARNRRTEIILAPKLDELMKLIGA